jgi:hypothetical protein
VLDIDPGPEVWNHPVYAYRVEYEPAGGRKVQGTISIWLADDGVEQDFLGIKVKREDYTFEGDMEEGDLVAGTCKWTGKSVKWHPDFAWYPYKQVAENPQVIAEDVYKLLGRRGPTGPDGPPVPPVGPPPNPDNPVPLPPGGQQVLALTPLQLLALVMDKTSTIKLTSWVDEFNAGKGDEYLVGQEFKVRGTADKAGYVYIFDIAPPEAARPGEQAPPCPVRLLFPLNNEDNRMEADKQFEFPRAKDKFKFVASEPIGTHTIKVIVTTRPLSLPGTQQQQGGKQGKQRGGQACALHLPPTQRQQFQQFMQHKPDEVQALIGAKPKDFLNDFGQCETPMYVTKPKKGKPDRPD